MPGHRVFHLPASLRAGSAGFPDAAGEAFPPSGRNAATGIGQCLLMDGLFLFFFSFSFSWRGPCLAGLDADVGLVQVPLVAMRAEGVVERVAASGPLLGFRRLGADGRADGLKCLLASGGAHPAAVADLMEALREDVGAEALGELLYRDGVGLFCVVVGAVTPGVGNVAVLDLLDTRVADGDLVGVAGEVFECLGRFAGRGLGVDDPSLRFQCREQRIPGGFIGERGAAAAVGELVLFAQCAQALDVAVAEGVGKGVFLE